MYTKANEKKNVSQNRKKCVTSLIRYNPQKQENISKCLVGNILSILSVSIIMFNASSALSFSMARQYDQSFLSSPRLQFSSPGTVSSVLQLTYVWGCIVCYVEVQIQLLILKCLAEKVTYIHLLCQSLILYLST